MPAIIFPHFKLFACSEGGYAQYAIFHGGLTSEITYKMGEWNKSINSTNLNAFLRG